MWFVPCYVHLWMTYPGRETPNPDQNYYSMIETPAPDVGGSGDDMEYLREKSPTTSFCGVEHSASAMRSWKMSVFLHSWIIAFGAMVLVYQFVIAAGA